MELYDRSRKHSPKSKDEKNFVEVAVREGDSLQSIAIKYGCKLVLLMRLNNLASEQQFFALKTLKVPVTPYGVAAELIKEDYDCVVASAAASASSTWPGDAGFSESSEEEWEDNIREQESERLLGTKKQHRQLSSDQRTNQFFSEKDKQIEKCQENLNRIAPQLVLDESVTTTRRPAMDVIQQRSTLCSVISVLIIVTVVTPLVYFIYFEFIRTAD